jgi:magnesium-transporting ATPase (P-type)
MDQLAVGDRFVVHPGEKIAIDGLIVSGRSAVDRSLLSGESLPMQRRRAAHRNEVDLDKFGRNRELHVGRPAAASWWPVLGDPGPLFPTSRWGRSALREESSPSTGFARGVGPRTTELGIIPRRGSRRS